MADVMYTAKYSTLVNEITEAWTFVMSHIEKVGADPQIFIGPEWGCGNPHDGDDEHGECFSTRRFGVVVEGSVPVL